MEKKNKKQREERKKEDIQRIRKLVGMLSAGRLGPCCVAWLTPNMHVPRQIWLSDSAMALDPRIARLKREEKERKAREKESKRQGGAAKDTNAAAATEAKKVPLIY